MLEVQQVSKIYEGNVAYRALTNIELTIESGEFVGIMGPSGSGKTTLLNLIATVDAPTTGSIRIGGKDTGTLDKNELAVFRRRELGFVFQDFNLLNTLTVEENIVLPLTLDGTRVREMKQKAQAIARKLGIEAIMKKRTYEISGGQAQRTAVARAMIHSPKLLLADEPTGNLDSGAARDVMNLLETINEQQGTTMMLVTHDAVAASYCHRVVFIKDGRFYTEIHRGDNRQSFFQKIIDTLSLLGGTAMTFRQFAFRNVSRNKRLYTAYFLSSMFTVMVFFTFSIFAYHPVFSADRLQSSAALALSVAKWIIYVFSFFFVLYSMSSFLQSRKREFGLMMMHGMTTRQLRRMIFLENMMIGAGATVSGIGLGVIFAKGILLAGERVLALHERLLFYFPVKAIVLTLISFMLLFAFISLFISAVLRSGKLITLIKASRQPKPEPKASILLSLLVVLLLGSGYYLALRTSGLNVMLMLVPVAVMVIIGTYLLFTQLSVYLIRELKAREGLFWRRTNMLLLSDLSYRMKDNARSFFLVAIISTVSFSSIGTLYGFQSMLNGALKEQNPYLFTYLSAQGDSKAETHIRLIDESLHKAGITAGRTGLALNYYKTADGGRLLILVKQSEYNRLAEQMGMKPIRLNNGKAAIVDFGLSRKGEELLNQPVKLQAGAVIEADQTVVSAALRSVSGYYVVSDEWMARLAQPLKVSHYYAWLGEIGQPGIESVGQRLTSKLPYDEFYNFYALEYETSRINDYFGPLMFIGLFVGIVFFVSAGSFLYFRLYSDLDEDKLKFKAISKLGLSHKELGKILNRQIGLLFFAPIVVALVHGAVALTALSHMFQYKLFKESVLVLSLFLLIQVIYFFIVRLFYTRQIRSALAG